jgi:hypothetical protein
MTIDYNSSFSVCGLHAAPYHTSLGETHYAVFAISFTSCRVGIWVLPSTCLIHPSGVRDNRIAPPTTLCALRDCFVQCARHPSLD